MEVEGETEFLNKLLGSFASADQQKHGEVLRSVETSHSILCRAIRRMSWVCAGALLLLWGNSFLAGLVPPQLYLFGERIAGVLLIGAGISYVVFALYRAWVRRQLAYYRQYCRSLVEGALEWRNDTAMRLQRFANEELHCAECKRVLLQVSAGESEQRVQSLAEGSLEHRAILRNEGSHDSLIRANS
jgi:hypothetical protein